MQNKKLLHKKVVVKRKLPINFNSDDKHLFANELNRKLPELYSFYYRNVCINSDQYL